MITPVLMHAFASHICLVQPAGEGQYRARCHESGCQWQSELSSDTEQLRLDHAAHVLAVVEVSTGIYVDEAALQGYPTGTLVKAPTRNAFFIKESTGWHHLRADGAESAPMDSSEVCQESGVVLVLWMPLEST
ncbi:hypothetical protein [Gordonia sihwensis]|uniref:hypothetical protein n=1 Tax=Gordonia sihwensis TaxID=173559 RepID=UPI003D963BB5